MVPFAEESEVVECVVVAWFDVVYVCSCVGASVAFAHEFGALSVVSFCYELSELFPVVRELLAPVAGFPLSRHVVLRWLYLFVSEVHVFPSFKEAYCDVAGGSG